MYLLFNWKADFCLLIGLKKKKKIMLWDLCDFMWTLKPSQKGAQSEKNTT